MGRPADGAVVAVGERPDCRETEGLVAVVPAGSPQEQVGTLPKTLRTAKCEERALEIRSQATRARYRLLIECIMPKDLLIYFGN